MATLNVSATYTKLRKELMKLDPRLARAFADWIQIRILSTGTMVPSWDKNSYEGMKLQDEVKKYSPNYNFKNFEAICVAGVYTMSIQEKDVRAYLEGNNMVHITCHKRKPIYLPLALYRKLSGMHMGPIRELVRDIYKMMDRYRAMGCDVHQWQLQENMYQLVTLEVFASPINAHCSKYGTPFPDTDLVFGSCGTCRETIALATNKDHVLFNPPRIEAFLDWIHVNLPRMQHFGRTTIAIPTWTDTPLYKSLYLRAVEPPAPTEQLIMYNMHSQPQWCAHVIFTFAR